jgi:hypothetical protein
VELAHILLCFELMMRPTMRNPNSVTRA